MAKKPKKPRGKLQSQFTPTGWVKIQKRPEQKPAVAKRSESLDEFVKRFSNLGHERSSIE